ncbi:uncharacterized protein LOC142353628 [Convolutriloba macropyga]|uniref:uncharacterized protein LOC142353628 n=1 Tax=Convolutriloba macropyga TaxID=536237 RepID=UPI003F5266A5
MTKLIQLKQMENCVWVTQRDIRTNTTTITIMMMHWSRAWAICLIVLGVIFLFVLLLLLVIICICCTDCGNCGYSQSAKEFKEERKNREMEGNENYQHADYPRD